MKMDDEDRTNEEIQHDILCEILTIARSRRYWKDEQTVGFHRGYIVGLIENNIPVRELPDDNEPDENPLPN